MTRRRRKQKAAQRDSLLELHQQREKALRDEVRELQRRLERRSGFCPRNVDHLRDGSTLGRGRDLFATSGRWRMERWKPIVAVSAREQRLLKLAGKSRKLFVFLREHRHELFDAEFQSELETMYRQTGQGQAPRPPVAIERAGFSISELYIDRGYMSSPVVEQLFAEGADVISRPWASSNPGIFSKQDFHFDLRSKKVFCPAGIAVPLAPGRQLTFPAELCNVCLLRAECTKAKPGRGRVLTLSEDELTQEKLRRELHTRAGRARLRARVGIEHRLAHLSRRSGNRTRYCGVRKNQFAVRRTSAVLNLEVLKHRQAPKIRSISNRSVS